MLIPVILIRNAPIPLAFAGIVILKLKFVMIVFRVSVLELNIADPAHFGIAFVADEFFEFVVSTVVFAVNIETRISDVWHQQNGKNSQNFSRSVMLGK